MEQSVVWLDGQIKKYAQFVDGSKEVVEAFQVLSKFGKGTDDHGDDELSSNQLTQGQFSDENKPTAETE